MKNLNLKILLVVISLSIIASIQPVLAANQYAVRIGARFRWDATYYYQNTQTAITINQNYYLAFNFTDWGNISGLEYVNGIVDNNGTVFAGEISHELYYGGTSGQDWATVILDVGVATYPVYIYLVCDTEIEQTTKPQMQNLDTNSWITFNEPSTNNFTLIGTYVTGPDTATYTGRVEFNSDKVLKYVFDELVQTGIGVTITERYIWTLTYTPGTGVTGGIPGYSLYFIIAAIAIGFLLLLKKKQLWKL